MQEQPTGIKEHSPDKPASIGMKSVTKEGVAGDDLAKQKEPTHMGVWEKLVGRANEENIHQWATSDCTVGHQEPGDPCQP